MPSFKKISNNIQKLVFDNPVNQFSALTWIDIKDAGKKEIEFLRKNYGFTLSHLQASSVKTIAQRPVIDKMDGYTFIILHFPIYKGDTIVAGEIEFFIGPDYLITLHNNGFDTLNNFFAYSKKDGNSLESYKYESSTILLYEIIERLLLECFTLLDKNSIAIEQLEDTIFAQQSKKAVSEILLLRRNIINTRKIMQNHKNIIKNLITVQTGFAPEKTIKKHFIDLLEHSKRFWEYLDNQKEMIEILNSTNESFLNYKLSDIMKTLTIFSVIILPLSLIAGIFGMNTVNNMPFMGSEHGFWFVTGLMMLCCLGMILFFSRKKWL